MKIIGMLGGTGWSSTIGYYTELNSIVHDELGGHHSAVIHLRSIDYHNIMVAYGTKNHAEIKRLLSFELLELLKLNPACLIICCNSLHKYYDMLKEELNIEIPVFHAVELTAKHLNSKNYKTVLLLATKFTMDDGFFADTLARNNINVIVPSMEEREEIAKIHSQELMHNIITEKAKNYFENLIAKYKNIEAVILGCTEFPLVVTNKMSSVPVIDPMKLQCAAALDFALSK